MRDLPISSAAVIWTDKGLKIVRTDACGDVIDAARFTRGRAKALPEALSRLLASCPPAPESGAGANPFNS